MPGAQILFGAPPSRGGGAERAAAAQAPLNVGFPSNLSFFVWLAIVGIIVPGLIVGGLKAGGFQFVFRGR